MSKKLVPIEMIENRIYMIRGQKVMLDRDLAALYGIDNRHLKRQVRRNIERFPQDFMFELDQNEVEEMVRHFGTPFRSMLGGSTPYAFTDYGILMLSSVLNSPRAVHVNIQIMRAFVRLRQMLVGNKKLAAKLKELERKVKGHDEEIKAIFDAINELMSPPPERQKKIGFMR